MRVEETIALAALIQATVVKLYKLHESNQGFRLYRRSLLMENKWRAARYGIHGKLIDFGKQMEVPERDLIEAGDATARAILEKRRADLDAGVALLIAKETLTAEEFAPLRPAAVQEKAAE